MLAAGWWDLPWGCTSGILADGVRSLASRDGASVLTASVVNTGGNTSCLLSGRLRSLCTLDSNLDASPHAYQKCKKIMKTNCDMYVCVPFPPFR